MFSLTPNFIGLSTLPSYLTITTNPNERIKELINEWNPDKVAILVDENTKSNCLESITIDYSTLIEIPSGEENKSIATCENVWKQLTQEGFTRQSLLINLGGGVIGDMGGFVAATYKRGMRFINLPTTLLSQVDASIGGKLGVDFGSLKNHIGVFKEPDQVIVNTEFLSTLPDRELRSGYAEMIKHALIADSEQWELLSNTSFGKLNWNELIPKSIGIKGAVVAEDPLERGLRKILNFGHTIGHAIESHWLNTPNKLLHGEAIAIGMIIESYFSIDHRWIELSDLKKITQYIRSVYPNLPSKLPTADELLPLMLQDKKNDSLQINFSILERIGKCQFNVKVEQEWISEAISAYEDLYK